jgi:hypothetical protein
MVAAVLTAVFCFLLVSAWVAAGVAAAIDGLLLLWWMARRPEVEE